MLAFRYAFLIMVLALASALRAAAPADSPYSAASAVPALPREGQTPMQAAQPAQWQGHRFEAWLELNHLPAQLILLPDRQPLGLSAQVEWANPSTARWRVRWFASEGTIQPLTIPGEPLQRALFHPPELSGRVMLRALLEVETPGSGYTLASERTFWVLPPVVGSPNGGLVDGYDIGRYPDPLDPRLQLSASWPTRHPDRYQPPTLFYRVDLGTRDLLIAPHQTLGIHAIDYPWYSMGLPQYIALDLNLVRKIEDLAEMMKADGFRITRFKSIYGYRSPRFNLGKIEDQPGINLKEPFSMHQYGRAIDLIIDEDGDENLDDLNGDGRLDYHDAIVMLHYANALDRRYRDAGQADMVGGAGLYFVNDFAERNRYLGRNSAYVHIDTRGFLNDDGTLVRWPRTYPDGTPIQWGKI